MVSQYDLEKARHDKIVKKRHKILVWTYRDDRVFINTEESKTKGIEGHYPDIVVMDIRKDKPFVIEEIETEGTVNEESAEKKWVPYSNLNAMQFRVYVPKGFKEYAEGIAEIKGIKDKVIIKEYQ